MSASFYSTQHSICKARHKQTEDSSPSLRCYCSLPVSPLSLGHCWKHSCFSFVGMKQKTPCSWRSSWWTWKASRAWTQYCTANRMMRPQFHWIIFTLDQKQAKPNQPTKQASNQPKTLPNICFKNSKENNSGGFPKIYLTTAKGNSPFSVFILRCFLIISGGRTTSNMQCSVGIPYTSVQRSARGQNCKDRVSWAFTHLMMTLLAMSLNWRIGKVGVDLNT